MSGIQPTIACAGEIGSLEEEVASRDNQAVRRDVNHPAYIGWIASLRVADEVSSQIGEQVDLDSFPPQPVRHGTAILATQAEPDQHDPSRRVRSANRTNLLSHGVAREQLAKMDVGKALLPQVPAHAIEIAGG